MTLAVFAALALLVRTAVADRVNTATEITGDTHMKALKSSRVREISEIKDSLRELHQQVDRLEAAQADEATVAIRGTSAESQGVNTTAEAHSTAVLGARAGDEERVGGVCCGAVDQSARRKMYTDFKWKAGDVCKKAWHNTHVDHVDDLCCNEKSRTAGAITRSDWSTDCMPDGSPRATARSCWGYHKGAVKDDSSCYCTKDFQHNNREMQVGWMMQDADGEEIIVASWWEAVNYGQAHCGPAYDAKFPFLSGCACMPRWDGKLMMKSWSPSRQVPVAVDLKIDP